MSFKSQEFKPTSQVGASRARSIKELKKFSKASFDKDAIFTRAEELKHTRLIKNYFEREYDEPSDDFVKFILDETYSGRKTKAIIDRYRPLVKRSFQSFAKEKAGKRLAKDLDDSNDEQEQVSEPVVEEEAPKIVTTDDEMEAYYIIRGILAEVVPPEKITYRDRQTYFGVLYDGKATRWICHLRFDDNRKSIEIPLGERSFTKSWKDTGKFSIDRLEDINRHADQLKAVLRNYV